MRIFLAVLPFFLVQVAGAAGLGPPTKLQKQDFGAITFPSSVTILGPTVITSATLTLNGNDASGGAALEIDASGFGPSTPVVAISSGNGVSRFFTILGNGNVGIGTSMPAAQFDILGSGGDLFLGGTLGSYNGIGLAGSIGVGNYNFLSGAADPNLEINRPTGKSIFFRENNADQMALITGGNLGIGTTNASAKLDVNGSVVIRSTLTVQGQDAAGYSVSVASGVNAVNGCILLQGGQVCGPTAGSNTASQFAAVATSTASIQAQFVTVGQSTASLQTQINNISTTTASPWVRSAAGIVSLATATDNVVIQSTLTVNGGSATQFSVQTSSGVHLLNGCIEFPNGSLQCAASTSGGSSVADVYFTSNTTNSGNFTTDASWLTIAGSTRTVTTDGTTAVEILATINVYDTSIIITEGFQCDAFIDGVHLGNATFGSSSGYIIQSGTFGSCFIYGVSAVLSAGTHSVYTAISAGNFTASSITLDETSNPSYTSLHVVKRN